MPEPSPDHDPHHRSNWTWLRHLQDRLYPRPVERGRWWQRAPGGRGRRHPIDRMVGGLVGFFAVGWTYGVALAVTTGAGSTVGTARLTANPFSSDAAPEAAFILDELVRRFSTTGLENVRGASGAVELLVTEPGSPIPLELADSLPEDVTVEALPVRDGVVDTTAPGIPLDDALRAPGQPGVWALALRTGDVVEPIPALRIITRVPLTRRRGGRIGQYLVGEWPFESGGTPPSEAYETPDGIVEVTPENVDLRISEHLTLGDFLTKGQADVWPKYVLVSSRLLDKVELTLQELEAMGHPVESVGIISGFRTPHYNAGGGNTSGRGDLSRHMYGDALDFYIDNDGDGRMDDLNGDGRVTVADARVLAEAADRVERKHAELVGGIGTYSPTGAHAGFVHVDTRGYRARW